MSDYNLVGVTDVSMCVRALSRNGCHNTAKRDEFEHCRSIFTYPMENIVQSEHTPFQDKRSSY